MAKIILRMVENNELENIRAALRSDPSLVNEGKGHDQPIHIAASDGKDKIIDLLIEYGADVNSRDEDQRTPLHRAAKLFPIVVERLLQSGAVPDLYDSFGYTPFAYAVEGQQPEGEIVIGLLRSANARYGLLESSAMAHASVVESILSANPAAILAEPSSETLLSLACLDGRYGRLQDRVKVVRLLLKYNLPVSKAALTAHIRACETYGTPEIAQLLRSYRDEA